MLTARSPRYPGRRQPVQLLPHRSFRTLWLAGAFLGAAGLGIAAARGGDSDPPKPRVDAHGDTLPGAATTRLGTSRFRNPGRVTAFCAGGSGGLCIGINGVSGVAIVWDVADGRQVARRELGDEVLPSSCAVSSDGATCVVGAWRGELFSGRLPEFDLHSAPCVFRVDSVTYGDRDQVYGTWGESIVRLDPSTGKHSNVLDGPWVTATGLRAAKRHLACVGNDGIAWLIDTAAEAPSAIPLPGREVSAVDFADEDGSQLVVARKGEIERMRRNGTRVWMQAVPEHGGTTAVRAIPSRGLFACGFRDGTVELRKLESGARVRELGAHFDKVTAIDWDRGDNVLSASDDSTIQRWPLDPKGTAFERGGFPRAVAWIRWAANGTWLFGGNHRGPVMAWRDGARRPARAERDLGIPSAVSADGSTVCGVAGEQRDRVRIRRLDSKAADRDVVLKDRKILDIEPDAAGQHVFVVDEHRVRSHMESFDRKVRCFSRDAERPRWEASVDACCVALSPDGSRLALGGAGALTIVDARDGRIVEKIPFPPGEPGPDDLVAFSASGRSVVCTWWSHTMIVRLGDAARVERVIEHAEADGQGLGFGGSDDVILVGGEMSILQAIDLRNPDAVRRTDIGSRINCVTVHPDGRLAVGMADSSILLLPKEW